MKLSFLNAPKAIALGTYGPPFLRLPFRLPVAEAKTHMHCIGITGSGKSRFLAGLYLELYRRGLSATLIDPHGDLSRLVLATLVHRGAFRNPQAFKNILYLDLPAAERQGRFLPFNVLNQPYDAHTTARAVLEALKRAWPSLDQGNAPTFENIVLAGTFVLIANKLPLPMLHDLLVNKSFRNRLLATTKDEQVIGFFKDRFDRWAREQPLLIESSLRRAFLLTFGPTLRYSLSQQSNLLNFRKLIEGNQFLIINLALGDGDSRRLLGCLLTVSAEQAALSRADLPPKQRLNGHYLLVDEFAEFTSQSEETLARILNLCRKYGLYLVMAHQNWSQTSERLRGALQNVGIEVAFTLGRRDAEYSAAMLGRVDPLAVKHEVVDDVALKRTHPVFYSLPEQWESWCQTLQGLKPREAVVRRPSGKVYQIRTLPIPDPKVDPKQLKGVEDYFLRTYFRPKADIEQMLSNYRKLEIAPATRRRLLIAKN